MGHCNGGSDTINMKQTPDAIFFKAASGADIHATTYYLNSNYGRLFSVRKACHSVPFELACGSHEPIFRHSDHGDCHAACKVLLALGILPLAYHEMLLRMDRTTHLAFRGIMVRTCTLQVTGCAAACSWMTSRWWCA